MVSGIEVRIVQDEVENLIEVVYNKKGDTPR
jgi:hypothetical protein